MRQLTSQTRRSEARHQLWFGLAALAPAGLLLALVVTYWVDVPFWDQWGTARFFGELARGRLTLADLFHPQNEYRQFFPHLLFVGMGWLTRWDVRAEMLVSFALACLVCLGVHRLGKLTAAGVGRQRLLAFLASSLLIFSPVQYENWLFGIQVVYFVPLACLLACLCVAASALDARAKFLLCALLSTVSTFSSANGLLCWVVSAPALAVSADFRGARRWRWAAAWAALLAANLALYLHGLGRPGVYRHAPAPLDALSYFLAFTGGPLALGPRPLLIAVPLGAALLTLYAAAWLYVLRRRDAALRRRATPWLMLAAFSVLTAALVTYGRADEYGLRQALSSRYTTFSLYLVVALAHLTPLVVEDLRARGRASTARLTSRLAAAAVLALVLAHPLVTLLVVRHGMRPARRERLYLKACLTFALAFEDDCADRLTNKIHLMQREADDLDRLGFLRPPLVRSPRAADLPTDADKAEGAFERLASDGAERLVASGRARLPGGARPPDAVLLAYQSGDAEPVLFALAEVGAGGDAEGWRKTISLSKLPPGKIILSAWAFDSLAGKAFKLSGTHDAR